MSDTEPTRQEAGTHFTIEIGESELTDEEIGAIQNKISAMAVEAVQASVARAGARRKEPYPRIHHRIRPGRAGSAAAMNLTAPPRHAPRVVTGAGHDVHRQGSQ